MAATGTAVLQAQPGTSWATAFPPVPPNGGQNLDIIQIVAEGQGVVLNVDSSGVVHNPASNATNGTRLGVFETTLLSGDTTAHYFANAFTNPANLDIVQVISPTGQSVANYIDYLGVSH